MTDDEEDAIVNTSAKEVVKQLTAGGKPVEAVVIVALFRGGTDYHVGTMLHATPEAEEDVERAHGRVLLRAADLIDSYVHERGLCDDCNQKKGTIQ